MKRGIVNSIRYYFLFVLLFAFVVARAQSDQVGIIDFYGNFSNVSQLRKCLPFKENDTVRFLSDSTYFTVKNEITACLLSLKGVMQADISFVCCDDAEGKWIAFIGVDTFVRVHPLIVKKKDVRLPEEVKNDYDSMISYLMTAIETGQAGENDTAGHSLSDYLPIRNIEEKFIVYANKNLKLLRKVLKESKHDKDREVAAWVIAYYKDKSAIIGDLLGAVSDNDNSVRNNAVRAIGIIANYANKHPDLKIVIPPDPFIEMMNSISWTDRNKSGMVLLSLTEKRDTLLLSQMKKQALEPIVDMARWKSTGHSYAGFVMLGRMAGWTDNEIWDNMNKDREQMIGKMLADMRQSH